MIVDCLKGIAIASSITTLTTLIPIVHNPVHAQDVAVLLDTSQAAETTITAQAGDLITVRLPDTADGLELWMNGQRVTVDNRYSYRSAFGDHFSVILLPHGGTYILRTSFPDEAAPVVPIVTPSTTYERLIAKANSLDNLTPQSTQTAIWLYSAAIEAAPKQVDPYLLRIGHTLATADRDIDFTDPTSIYSAYGSLTATEQGTVQADIAKVVELSTDNDALQQLFAAYGTLLSTGVAPSNFDELLENVAAQDSDSPPPASEIDETSSNIAPQEAQ